MRDALTRSLGRRVGAGAQRHRRARRRPHEPCASTSPSATPRSSRRRRARGYASARGIDVDPARDPRPKARRLARARGRPNGALARPSTASARGSSPRSSVAREVADAAQRQAELDAAATRMLGPAGLTQRSAHFTRREVIQALAEAHPAGAAAGVLEALADDVHRDVAACRSRRARRRAGARPPGGALLDARHAPLRGAPARGGRGRRPARRPRRRPRGASSAAIAARPTLGADQAAAVRHLCSGRGAGARHGGARGDGQDLRPGGGARRLRGLATSR